MDTFWRSGTRKVENGRVTANPLGEMAFGGACEVEATPDEPTPLGESPLEWQEPWFSREPSWHGRDAAKCRQFLESLTDEEIVGRYDLLRDEKVVSGGGNHYPNIKHLFLTPFEREKDRREVHLWKKKYGRSDVEKWYEEAKNESCIWWLKNHLVAKHAFKSCMSCGACTSGCPAAEFYDYNPRTIMETIQSGDEEAIVDLLKSDTLWYCAQCGTCKLRCSRGNNPFALVSSLRQLSQLKGYHVGSKRGRQQYTARHLWGGNFWNRACCLYFRNTIPRFHLDFGPRFVRYVQAQEEIHRRVGGCPDMDGSTAGRKVHPDSLQQARRCWQVGGTFVLWEEIEKSAQEQAREWNMDIDDYFYMV